MGVWLSFFFFCLFNSSGGVAKADLQVKFCVITQGEKKNRPSTGKTQNLGQL